jgi:predicted Ser/Thr protein kinase
MIDDACYDYSARSDAVGLYMEEGTDASRILYGEVSSVERFMDREERPERVDPMEVDLRYYVKKRDLTLGLRGRSHLREFLQCPPEVAKAPTTYVKKPKAMWLETLNRRQQGLYLLEKEARICDQIRRKGGLHPNIAHYHGMVVENDRITGLAFEKYVCDLHDIDWFSDRVPDLDRVYNDIREGIRHLHSVGYCHNDLKPMNICLTEEGRAVIIDFDSAMPTGEKLKGRYGTRGWSDRTSNVSRESNDFYSLAKIKQWLDKKAALIAQHAAEKAQAAKEEEAKTATNEGEDDPDHEPEDGDVDMDLDEEPQEGTESVADDTMADEEPQEESPSVVDDTMADADFEYESPVDETP